MVVPAVVDAVVEEDMDTLPIIIPQRKDYAVTLDITHSIMDPKELQIR